MTDISIENLFIILFVLLLLSAFLSGSETSLMSVNRYKLKHRFKLGEKSAEKVNFLITNPDKTLGLILLLNNFVNILASAISTLIAIQLYGQAGVAISVFALTVVILIFAEVTPKTFAALYPDKIAYPVSWVFYLLMKIFYPLVVIINFLSKLLLRVFGIKSEYANQELLTKDEIKLIVKESSERIPKSHEDMIVNMLDLEKVKVEDAMIPRGELIAVDIELAIHEIEKSILSCKHSRIPIYRNEFNKLLGFLHKRKIIEMLVEGNITKEKIINNINPPYFIPEDTSLTSQLIEFKKERKRIGFVVDEYGDVKGVVTLDDILEEIVGDFKDSNKGKGIHKIKDKIYLIDGATQIREINKFLNWKIPEDVAKTMNGYILESLEDIPSEGANFERNGYIYEIIQVSNNFVKNVKVIKK
jgi:Mg2+/Co2+ transporter CorB|tara:strand:- start:6399 stop:7646 length:1248 start_codon:yes stop_codon:yes gene_type:complete